MPADADHPPRANDQKKKDSLPPVARAAKFETDRINSAVGLTKEQTTKVQHIEVMAASKIGAAREKYGPNRQGLTKEMEKITAERDASLKGVLTPDQWVKYEKMRADDKKRLEEQKKRMPTPVR